MLHTGSADVVQTLSAQEHINLVQTHTAPNYAPLPVVLTTGQGAWAVDVEGKHYLDCLSAYSAVNFGHSHPQLLAAARTQLDRLTLPSRAFYHDQLGPFCDELAALVGKNMVLPMNTGAEAVESGIKLARKWGYEVKGVRPDRANIVVMSGNFHGRTTTIVGFSDDDDARRSFGPFAPGFRTASYGDISSVASVIDEDTVAVLLEPVQGEAGVIVPPPGFLAAVRGLCDKHGALLIADEIQSGLGRTGKTLACEHSGVVADVYLLGKALGGGIVPVSAVVADRAAAGPSAARAARVHLRWQSAGLRSRSGSRRDAPNRRVAATGLAARTTPVAATGRTSRLRSRRRPHGRALGWCRHQSPGRERPRDLPRHAAPRHPGQGHPQGDDQAGAAAGH